MMGKVLVNAADITHVQPLSRISVTINVLATHYCKHILRQYFETIYVLKYGIQRVTTGSMQEQCCSYACHEGIQKCAGTATLIVNLHTGPRWVVRCCSSHNLCSTLAFARKDWEKSHKTSVRTASKWHSQDSNQASLEYMSKVLLQHQPIWHYALRNNTTSERAFTCMVCSIFCITEKQDSTRVRIPPHEKSI